MSSQKYNKETDQVKSYLSIIDSNINDFKYRVNNSVEQTKENCMKLRNEIQLEAELRIKKIQDLCEDKINELNKYEEECISTYKSEIEAGFITEMVEFQKECKILLEDSSTKVIEMQNLNELGFNILERIKEQNEKLDNLSSGSVIEFLKNPNETDKETLGRLELKRLIKFDPNNTKTFCIKHILPKLDEKHTPKFQYLKNHKIAVAFIDLTKRLNFVFNEFGFND